MSGLLKYWFGAPPPPDQPQPPDQQITVSVAESITAGAVATILCSEPGSSAYFKGSIVAYNAASKRDILHLDISEKINHANSFTTLEMAKAAVRIFNSRIGLATTGYSLPVQRPESKNQCALNVIKPYAVICLYDHLRDYHIITQIEFEYDQNKSRKMQRANVQAKVALETKKMFDNYVSVVSTAEK